MKQYYPPVRALHLYTGLFLSPFILIFCISVLALNHAGWLDKKAPVSHLPVIKAKIRQFPHDTSDLNTAKAIISELKIDGEIDFIYRKGNHFAFPVTKPGLKLLIDVDTLSNDVTINRTVEGTIRATNYLHKMPGPHNENIRGNSAFLKLWRVLADTVVYLLLFLSASGVFLWYFLKVERKLGLFAIVLGTLTFSGLLLFIL
jgi:hypothetical protein